MVWICADDQSLLQRVTLNVLSFHVFLSGIKAVRRDRKPAWDVIRHSPPPLTLFAFNYWFNCRRRAKGGKATASRKSTLSTKRKINGFGSFIEVAGVSLCHTTQYVGLARLIYPTLMNSPTGFHLASDHWLSRHWFTDNNTHQDAPGSAVFNRGSLLCVQEHTCFDFGWMILFGGILLWKYDPFSVSSSDFLFKKKKDRFLVNCS